MLRIQITIQQVEPGEGDPEGTQALASEIHCFRLKDDLPTTPKELWFADILGDAMQKAIEITGKEVGEAQITHVEFPRDKEGE